MQPLINFFGINGLLPHGYCLTWSPTLLWLNVLSDALIVLAYYSIPLTLAYFIRKRVDLPYPWLFTMFGLFVVACGTSHLLSVITIWVPLYWLDGIIKAITAVISVIAAVMIFRIVPRALMLRSPPQLEVEVQERKQAEGALQQNQMTLKDAQRIARLGSWQLDVATNHVVWSEELYRMLGLNPALPTPNYTEHSRLFTAESWGRLSTALLHTRETGVPYELELEMVRANGSHGWMLARGEAVRDASGSIVALQGVAVDITERKQAEDQLRIAATTFETHEAIMITDIDANIIRVNHAFEKITGYSAEEVIGKNPRILSSGRHDKNFYAKMWQDILSAGIWSGEIWDRHKSGNIYPKQVTISAVKNDEGETTQYVAIFSDITDRMKAEAEIHNLAFYDALTGLPNRRLLFDRLRLALSASARNQQYGALLFLDLDHFKTINDTLGHGYGDVLLVEVANRLKLCVREVDTVARLGGDEFVVLIEDISANEEDATQNVAHVAEKIRAVLAALYVIDEQEHYSSPSIGVSLFRGNDESVNELIKRADMAMYQAKESGRNKVRFFDPKMQQSVETRAALEVDLRHAIIDQQFQLYYQIQMDHEQHPIGAEALVRWIHPQRGMVSPAQFIPIAEGSSLILEIGHWVLDTACQQIAAWSKNEKTRDLVLAVNISAHQFKQPDFVEQIDAVIRKHGIEPSRLKLELTESVALDGLDIVVVKMIALRLALGVTLSLDDFGTGYSSLSYLKRLPLDQLKIDQSFVRDITTDDGDAMMVKTIIGMAHNFGLNVIAEGVETEAQLAFLAEHGCMAYQGYLFSKPVPIEQFEALLK